MSSKRLHAMPFGAETRPDGSTRFRLWAPGAREVDLLLVEGEGSEARHPMTPEPEGWFSCSATAREGDLYHYQVDGGRPVPDPASRHQPQDVHGPSRVVDPNAWRWADGAWRGRPWAEAVILELHVGTFSPSGDFRGAIACLDHVAAMGFTAIELLPLADFPGRFSWGYDGVCLFAPDASYGPPEDLKLLVQEAHARGLMVLLDVVYNHFGPEGNYLHLYARSFFHPRRQTPWGAAIDMDGPGSRWVRRFFIENALFWLEEYHFDGLRFDAVQAIEDHSERHFLKELAAAVSAGPGARRPIHLILENDDNAVRYLEVDDHRNPLWHRAQWNDDFHHALHRLLTGERHGYYQDYAPDPVVWLGRTLAEGFGYQGETSAYRQGRRRGEKSAGLPPTAFVNCLQNHDQIGNRILGDRIAALASPEALRAGVAILLLAPAAPMVFMGEEWGSRRPFHFFCDFEPGLASAVSRGRRKDFVKYVYQEPNPRGLERMPEPGAMETFAASRLDWESRDGPEGAAWLAWFRNLLAIRHAQIVPRIGRIGPFAGRWEGSGVQGLRVVWRLDDGSELVLTANLSDEPRPGRFEAEERAGDGSVLFQTHSGWRAEETLPAWLVDWRWRGAGDQTD